MRDISRDLALEDQKLIFKSIGYHMVMYIDSYLAHSKYFMHEFHALTDDKEYGEYGDFEKKLNDLKWHVQDIDKAATELKRLYESYFINNEDRNE